MHSGTRILLAACLLAVISVSAGVITKRVIKTKPLNGVPNQQALTILPINVAGMVGGDVTLLCEVASASASRVHWWEFVTTGSGQMISDNGVILPSHPNNARYTIIKDTVNTFNLHISNLELADGGTYVCLDGNSGPPATFSGQAELVVLAANPNCSSLIPDNGVVMEGQNYTVSCQIYYGGNQYLAPSMTWTGPEPFLTITIPAEDNVYSGITFTVDRVFDTLAYACLTNFTKPTGVPGGVADNAPEYEHVYQTEQLFVYWGPKNMRAEPIRPTYAVGDVITCFADAFPPAFYQWQNMRTFEVFAQQTYTISEDDVGYNTSLRCLAQNLIQGFLYAQNLFISALVPAPTTLPTTPSTTTPPAEANCRNLTGWWRSENPYAEMHLRIPAGQSAQVLGFMRNATDQQWVELVGRTRIDTYDYVGLTAIWPYEVGVTGMAGECHNCNGVEVIYTGGLWRSSYAGQPCALGGNPSPHVLYSFHKVSDDLYDIHDPSFKVYNPSRHVSGRFGIKHLVYE